PDDFIVEERPAYAPSGAGTHQYLWIEKRGIDTNQAIRLLADYLRRPVRDFGVAGLKDKHAVARQHITIEHVPAERFAAFQDDRLKILSVTLHGNKLKIGHLKGNRFSITVRDLTIPAADACARAEAIFAQLRKSGLPNFYGPQRFGREGANVARAYQALTGNVLPGTLAPRWGGSADTSQLSPLRRGSHLDTFLLNSLQSALFNAVAAERLAAGTVTRLIPGDLAFLHRNGAVFAVPDTAAVAREQPRAEAGVDGAPFEISPSGPMFGRRMTAPTADALAIEQAVLRAWNISDDHLNSSAMREAPGARRPLRVPLENAAVEAVAGNEDAYRVSFDLPAGSYATVVLNELIKTGDIAEAPSV
ncbi:MAG TPA: tRNA pseudouridine(13) synthase TruD, partial [Planctomycetota bacterium]|nr:tRNA pseudouridine(13) synthase TruD [Planctomycetota bacterium]